MGSPLGSWLSSSSLFDSTLSINGGSSPDDTSRGGRLLLQIPYKLLPSLPPLLPPSYTTLWFRAKLKPLSFLPNHPLKEKFYNAI
ncbi:unnamed protein product [Linum trigynum]|uniref:Uncharacterized protein n=1 Tax=Linum trigynum TaxID=586398 RepID=A0AAV2F4B1_9ROSI